MFNHWDVVLDFVKACVRMTVIWVFSTILAIVLDSWGIRAENLLLVYLVGVLISILEREAWHGRSVRLLYSHLPLTICLRNQS